MTEKTLTYDALGIAPDDVFLQMGYGGRQPDAATRRETEAQMALVRPWLRPRYCYLILPDLPADFNVGAIISRQLRGSEAYALFVATAGTEYEDYQRRLTRQGDMVKVFMADALGSVIAERCADTMEQHLQESIGKLGWKHTNRFSPGYCGWPVGEQQRLFPLFGGRTCDVRLTDSSLMVPIKSVSGVIGLGPQVSRKDYTCHLCDYAHCYKRRLRPA